MLYTLAGNGDANRKEVLATLESLLSATQPDDEFWMALVVEENPSKTTLEIIKFLNSWNVYFEVIADKVIDVPEAYSSAQEVHRGNDRFRLAMNFAERRVQPPEGSAILIMDDDLEENDYLMNLVSGACDIGIPVYELGGQMVQIILEDSITDLVEPTLKEITPDKAPSEDIMFSRPDLEELTLNELKVLVNSMDLVPRDMRSKDSLIDAILAGTSSVETTVEEPPAQVDNRKYYLMVLDEDGSVTVSPIDKDSVVFPT
jgi:hypothetical protein